MSKGAWSLKVTQSRAAMLECEEGWLIGRRGEQLDWGSGEQRDRWTDRVDNAVSSSEWQGWLQGPSAWKYPHLYKRECDFFVCACQGDTKRKKYVIHSSCKMEKKEKKGHAKGGGSEWSRLSASRWNRCWAILESIGTVHQGAFLHSWHLGLAWVSLHGRPGQWACTSLVANGAGAMLPFKWCGALKHS